MYTDTPKTSDMILLYTGATWLMIGVNATRNDFNLL